MLSVRIFYDKNYGNRLFLSTLIKNQIFLLTYKFFYSDKPNTLNFTVRSMEYHIKVNDPIYVEPIILCKEKNVTL